MIKPALALAAALLWPAATLAAPTDGSEQQQAASAEAAGIRAPAPQIVRGVVDSIDERSDTIRLRLSADRTEPFKVQDGLLFNAVRFGDPVAVSVQTVSGVRTIVGLSKE
ncbi:hypothetical protein [Bradyrhizobium sp. CCBAU 51753]|uniref:hypothetical protein n=1 Tax=Bradyrhizobium sp. CCBAU 51753 TaxID=1325100 RepID=UPI00188CCE75|nr:hypothetical protein [Bradyrhizobium sp. CCBAU 51753]QOZ23072.1 hypothetical protein XH93_04925 [Bradyrhizobium sp. CCBAU 51753]